MRGSAFLGNGRAGKNSARQSGIKGALANQEIHSLCFPKAEIDTKKPYTAPGPGSQPWSSGEGNGRSRRVWGGLEPAAACGGFRQAERPERKGVNSVHDYFARSSKPSPTLLAPAERVSPNAAHCSNDSCLSAKASLVRLRGRTPLSASLRVHIRMAWPQRMIRSLSAAMRMTTSCTCSTTAT